jgi:hypothetical protein
MEIGTPVEWIAQYSAVIFKIFVPLMYTTKYRSAMFDLIVKSRVCFQWQLLIAKVMKNGSALCKDSS